MFVHFDLIVVLAAWTVALIFIDEALHWAIRARSRGASDWATSRGAGTDQDHRRTGQRRPRPAMVDEVMTKHNYRADIIIFTKNADGVYSLP
jgi:hypothetical protein